MDLRGVERGNSCCWSGVGIVSTCDAKIAEGKSNYMDYDSQSISTGKTMFTNYDSLHSSTPLEVRLSQVVCGQPAFLGAPVLKTVLRNPLGHFPPPVTGAVALFGAGAGPEVEELLLEVDAVLLDCDPVLLD